MIRLKNALRKIKPKNSKNAFTVVKAFLIFVPHRIILGDFMKKISLIVLMCATMIIQSFALETSAKSAILYDADYGNVLYEKNADERLPIASTTKIMTAILAIENADLDEVVTVKKAQVGVEGTSLYLKENEKITVKTLLYGLMLRSGNDAAEVLACHVSGSIQDFVSLMNEKAKELSMTSTVFKNPHGLPNDEHLSTARDMAKLTAYAMQNATFREIVSSKSYSGEGKSFVNHNKLLKMSERVKGVKTGYTKAAGRCLVSSAVADDLRLVAVTLNDPNDWDDHLDMFDFGFSEFTKFKAFARSEIVSEVSVAGTGVKVPVAIESKLEVVAGKDENVKCEIFLPHFCYPPINKGDIIGEARIVKDGEILASASLFATETVFSPEKKDIFHKIKSIFKK